MNLDEPARFGEVDSLDALRDIEAAADQWAEGFRLDVPALAQPDAVVVTGMGGSGIAGDVAAALAADAVDFPVVVHKGYGLPAFAGAGTLVVAVSHSGRTAETLDAARTALERGARLVGVCGGGELAQRCPEVVRIPQRTPPRHALPLLCAPVLRILGLAGDVTAAVEDVVGRSGRDVPTAENAAKQLGRQIAAGGAVTALGSQGVGAVGAYRLACQLAENAKVSAAHGEIPEAAHNLVASWGSGDPRGGIVVLRDPDGESPELTAHAVAVSELAGEAFAWTAELHGTGGAPVARLASLMATVDLVSVYAALALDRDPTPIEPIERIKSALRP